MKKKYGWEIFEFDGQRDPPGLANMKNLGVHIFVVRNPNPVKDPVFHRANFGNQVIDPGGNFHGVGVHIANGDVFYYAPNLSNVIRRKLDQIKEFQSERDKDVNATPFVKSSIQKIEKLKDLWLDCSDEDSVKAKEILEKAESDFQSELSPFGKRISGPKK